MVLGVVEEKAQLLELALDEAQVQVLALVGTHGVVELALERGDLLGGLARRHLVARGGELLLRFLVGRIGGQALAPRLRSNPRPG